MLAKFIPDIFELVKKINDNNNSEIKNIVLKSYIKLLQDKEGEVRSTACQKLEEAAEFLKDMEEFDKILSCLKNLKSDPLPYVRSSLASNILSVAPIVNTKKTNEFIFSISLDLIKDEAHDIRMLIIKNLDRLNEVVNINNYVQGIIPSLIEISDNNNWRIRNEVQEIIPTIALIVDKKLFLENIMPICLKWLTDQVYVIRQNACKILKKIYGTCKSEEFKKKLLNKIGSMAKNESYLIRTTVVLLIKEFLKDEYELDFVEKKLFPILAKLSKDLISNVRQSCAQAVKKLVRLSKNKDVVKECKDIIDELKIDKDMEVVYAANEIYEGKLRDDISDTKGKKFNDIKTGSVKKEEAKQSQEKKRKIKFKKYCNAFNVSNNKLTTIEGIQNVLEALLPDLSFPSKLSKVQLIQWIDISRNKLTSIHRDMCELHYVKILYVHGNNIQEIEKVTALGNCKSLTALTLYGNPMDHIKGYRNFIIEMCPLLEKLDGAVISEKELDIIKFHGSRYGEVRDKKNN